MAEDTGGCRPTGWPVHGAEGKQMLTVVCDVRWWAGDGQGLEGGWRCHGCARVGSVHTHGGAGRCLGHQQRCAWRWEQEDGGVEESRQDFMTMVSRDQAQRRHGMSSQEQVGEGPAGLRRPVSGSATRAGRTSVHTQGARRPGAAAVGSRGCCMGGEGQSRGASCFYRGRGAINDS